MKTAIGNRNLILKTLLCVFSILLLAGSACAWDEAFEGNPSDLGIAHFTGFTLGSITSGLIGSKTALVYSYTDPTHSVLIDQPFTGYIGFSFGDGYNTNSINLKLNDTNGVTYFYGGMGMSTTPRFLEWIEKADKSGINIYYDGNLASTVTYSGGDHNSPGSIRIYSNCGGAGTNQYIDDITTSSSHSMIGCDGVCSLGETETFDVGACIIANNYYIVKCYDPNNLKVYEKNFSANTALALKTGDTIPAANITKVGTYTLHLYRQSGSTYNYLTQKTFKVSDATGGTGTGTLTLDKSEYEAGETVTFWSHIPTYVSGYTVVCDFPAAGANFKKTVSITADPFMGTFTIPDISSVIGAHTAYLLDPSGKVAASADFVAFIPGLPDIALDKDTYSRTDQVHLYYKDLKSGSTITVNLINGGTLVQSIPYTVSGSGTLKIDLTNRPSANSIMAICKESDGYTVDQDNAKIVIGQYVLSGRIYNSKTGSAVSNASIHVLLNSTTSDIDGNYNISALAGFSNYSVNASGYHGISGTVAVFNMDTIHNFYISPIINNGGTGVYGTVVSAKTDFPLTGASVSVINNDNGKRFSTVVDSKGYYEVNNGDLAGNLTITVALSNYDTAVSTSLVSAGGMNNLNFRLNAVTGYQEVDLSESSGGSGSTDPGQTAAERAYEEKYGEMGKHPFDFNGDGQVENSEWKYAFERIAMLVGLLAFMGFMTIVSRRR